MDRVVDLDQVALAWGRVRVDLIWVLVDRVVDLALVVQDQVPVDQVAHKEDLLDRAVLVEAILEEVKVQSFFVDENKVELKKIFITKSFFF